MRSVNTSAPSPIELIVAQDEADLRLDQFIRRRIPGISRGSVQRLLENRLILVEGRAAVKGLRLHVGQQILVASAAQSEQPIPQSEMDLDILCVRPDLIVMNKPAGIPSHPLVPGETDTLANALVARFPECASASPWQREGGLVHRLDWSTSGVILAARSPEAYGRLRGLFSSGKAVKHYLALVDGRIHSEGKIQQPLRTRPGDSSRMQVVADRDAINGQSAETEFFPLERLGAYTLVHVRCKTGRRHQVRVHLAHLGHPLVGDELYGGSSLPDVNGAFLHAHRLELGEAHEDFSAPMPSDRWDRLLGLGASSQVLQSAWTNTK